MFRQFRDSLMGSWGSLTASARLQLVLTGVATAALVVFVVAWGATPQYVNLYSGLPPEDTVAIKSKLVEMDIPFRVEGNGGIIQVPRNLAANARLDLSAEGIPSSPYGVGFEIFDTTDLMTSKFVNDVNYKRAMMGTLQQMLNGLDFVNNSQVYIERAENSYFTGSQEPSKAAVTLDVRSKPTQKQVEGLLGIITSFGPANLTKETVTLTLSDGTVLNAPGTDEFGGLSDTMLEANRSMEREYKKKAEADLAAIGVASVVSVSVERDFSRQTQYEEKFDKGQTVSRETDTTSVSSTENSPQGPAGAIANIPESDSVIPGGTQTTEETESKTENFDLPSTVTTTDFAVGRVKSVTASASVGAKRIEVLDDEGNPTGEYTYEKYSDEEVEHFKTTIANSIGYGMTKEEVEVAALDRPLDSLVFAGVGGMGAAPETNFVGKMNSVTSQILQNPIVWWGTRILLVIAALVILRRLARGFVEEEMPEEEEEVAVPGYEREATPEELRRQEIADEVNKISQQEPEAVAALLRTWLTEDQA